MISVLMYIDDATFDKAFKQASSGVSKRKSLALGKIGEEITKGVFKSKKEATTASGKADIIDIPIKNVIGVLNKVEATNKANTASINKMLKDNMGKDTIDIEAKATAGFLGGYKGSQRGTLKITQATPSLKKIDKDYVQRQRELITQIVELGVLKGATQSKKIDSLFESLKLEVSEDYSREDIQKLEAKIYSIVSPEDIKKAYNNIMQDPRKFEAFMKGPFGNLVTDKVKNLTVQINAKSPEGKKLRFFQTFLNLKFSTGDIVRKKSGNAYRFYLSSAFENKLIAETKKKINANAIGVLESDVQDALSFRLSGKTGLQKILQSESNLESLVESLSFNQFTVSIPSGGSIDLSFGIDATNLLNSLNTKIPNILANNYKIAQTVKKGRFMSAPQLTSLLRLEVYARMKKSGKAAPPMLTYRSGRFVENLEVAQINYKNSVIRYFSMPLYYSLEEYDYEVEDLIESSLREITQRVYSRQFNLVRA